MHPRYTFLAPLSISLILSAPLISAQVTLNNGDLTPLPGESFPSGLIPWAAPGPGGTGQTWDFSTVAPSTSLTYNWIAPTIDQLAEYPTCAVLKTTPGYFEFYELAPNVLSELGIYYGITLTDISYDDPRDEMRYPFSLGSSYVDDFGGLRIHNVGGLNDTTVLTGTFSVTADGEGTLVLPWATFTDVLRLHVERNDIDDATDTTHTDEYRFVKAGLHSPLLRIYEISYSWQPNVLQVARVLLPDPTGVQDPNGAGASITYADEQLHINCSPNPVDRYFTLTSTKPFDTHTRVVLRDALGREVITPFSMHKTSIEVDATALTPGTYTISLSSSTGTFTRRFVKQ